MFRQFCYRPFFAIFALAAVLPASAYNPPPGGEEWNELVSPSFLGLGQDITDTEAIMGSSVNPALGALREQGAASFGYTSLIGEDTDDDQQFGHVVSAGALLPTRIGVLGANLTYVDSRLSDMDLGQLGRARVSYSRDIFPQLLIGAAANLMVGTQDEFGLGLSADLGFVHLLGPRLGMEDLRWGVTAQTLGIGFNPHEEDADGDDITGFPSIFTPTVGVSAVPWANEDISTGFATWVSTPRVQNLRIGGRVTVEFREFLTAGLGMRWDLHQSGEPSDAQRSLIPSLGVEVNITRLIERRRGEDPALGRGIRAVTGVAPMVGDVVAVGVGVEVPFGSVDRAAPEVAVTAEDRVYVSPNNDGSSDDIVLPITISDDSPIQSYELIIEDAEGQVVRRIENKDPRPELNFDALVAEIREGETGVTVPEEIRWDGADQQGSVVPDGEYRYRLVATDLNGNRAESAARTVVIDTTPPELTVTAPEALIFSPNDDGNQERLVIDQSGTAEQSVSGRLVNAEGTPVRTFSWDDTQPQQIVWDGTNDQGEPVSDGVYRYEIESVDRAGNLTRQELAGIILNRETQSVFVRTDRERFRESVTFALLFPTAEGLEDWTFEIRADDGGVLRSFAGTGANPEPIVWNGTNEAGEARDGEYVGVLLARYANGGEPQARTRTVVRDTQAPQVELDITPQPFSPDNDGFEDELEIGVAVQDASPIDRWTMTIFDSRRGDVFRSISGTGTPSAQLRWDGLSETGELVQAAEDYPWELTISDVLGNETRRTGEIPVDVLVIREDGRLKIRISNITFAPNSPQFVREDAQQFEKNIEIINRIAEILERYDRYQIQIEGHAVNITGTEREEEEELQPLSRARAETVIQALVERGLDEDRFTAVGMGGTKPLVPHTDLDERWRNRRVEFILLR